MESSPSSGQGAQITDPCGDFGPNQRWALIWFLAVVVGGILVVSRFAAMDSWMYENNAEFLDMQEFKENRMAQTTLASESVDPRSRGDLTSIEAKLNE